MRNFHIDLVWTKVQIAIIAIGGWIGYFVGGMDGMLIALIVLMSLDYISGIMCAVIDKKLSSAIGFRGICKKVLILMLVGVPIPDKLREALAQLHGRDGKDKDDTTDQRDKGDGE